MEEIYKDIAGYEGLYQVSNFGNVKSRYRVLTTCKNVNGYGYVCLSKNNTGLSKRVHRLVATAFIPNTNNYPQINHLNENKLDNRVENLEWCDNTYNTNYGARNEKASKKLSIKIEQLDINDNLIKIWDSIRSCSEHGFNHSHISKVCNGKLKTHKGFKWQIYEPNRSI